MHKKDEAEKQDSQEISLVLSGENNTELEITSQTTNGLGGNDSETPQQSTPVEHCLNSCDTVTIHDDSFRSATNESETPPFESDAFYVSVKQELMEQKETLLLTEIPSTSSFYTAMEELKSASEILNTEEANPMATKPAFTRLFIELTYLTRVEANKVIREILTVNCDPAGDKADMMRADRMINRKSDSPGYMADISNKQSPVSGHSATTVIAPTLINRMSYVSHTSSSSMGSSAGALHVKNLLKQAVQAPQLSDEKIDEIKGRWLNTDQLLTILQAIDGKDSYVDAHSSNGDAAQFVQVMQGSGAAAKKLRTAKRQAGESGSQDSPLKKRSKQTPVFKHGMEVFAKWSDRHYYAAKLVSKADNKWVVKFYDGGERNVLETQLLVCDFETLRGQRVYATQTGGGDDYQKGIVDAVDSSGDTLMYLILTDLGDFSVPSSNLYLTESQGRAIKKGLNIDTSASSSSAVDCAGASVTSSLRTTRSRSLQYTCIENPKPCTSGLQRDPPKPKVKQHVSESDDDYSDSSTSVETPVVSVTGCERELQSSHLMFGQVKLKNMFGKLPRSVDGVDATIVGPIPIGNWFKGWSFLLTSTATSKLKSVAKSACVSDCDSSATDNEDYEFSSIPFIEDRLKLQLENGSGKVYKNFEDIPPAAYHTAYLISDRPNLTARYQQCLAAGIKILCHAWVVRCCTEKKLVHPQELPLGWSIESKRFVNSFERVTQWPLRGHRMYIAQLHDKNFFKFWSRLCCLAGGIAEKFTAQSRLEGVLCILVEQFVQDPALDLAQRRNVPLVSTMWFTQTLIHGKIRPFDRHLKYNYLYDDSDE